MKQDIVKRFKKDLKGINLDFLERAIFNHEELELFEAFQLIITGKMNSIPHKTGNTVWECLGYINQRLFQIKSLFTTGREK